MPFTPYHLGPGILAKALLPGGFSLMVFGWSQILIDLQPLFVLLGGPGELHGITHTYLGATALGIVAAVTGKFLIELAFQRLPTRRQSTLSWTVALVSAMLGTYSHVFLDSIMHRDVRPFYPLSPANGLFRWVSLPSLHRFCIYSGALGSALYLAFRATTLAKQQSHKGEPAAADAGG